MKINLEQVKKHCLHNIFEAQVSQNPQGLALTFNGQNLTYNELNIKANKLAHYLQELGVKSEVMVGLYLEPSLETIISILAVIKAGGAYVPLDSNYPQERLNYILKDSKIEILITKSDLNKLDFQGKSIFLDQEQKIIEQKREDNPNSDVTPNNLLYVIYTSGTTGQPKGVMINHYNVVNLFEMVKTYFNFNKNDIWTQFHSYSFGFSVWEIWGCLLHGGKLVIVPQKISQSPEEFYDLLIQEKVTILSQTPTAFRLLTHVDKSKGNQSLSLRYIIFSGEPLETYLLKSWLDKYGDSKPELINMYAITETSGEIAYRRLTKTDLIESKSSIIGVPLSGVEFYLLDEQMQPVSNGEMGEIYIGGNAVGRGYLNQPELTAEKFISNPFGEGKLYKTGDLGRYLSTGEIAFCGRSDNQIKIRGYRIELAEIEAKLAEYPLVKETVVIVNENEDNKQLIAYIIPENTQQLNNSHQVFQESKELEIWPSLGEYNIYDDLLYYIMGQEATINDGFKNIIQQSVKNKIVVDIGTGQEAIFARLCVEFGAKKVYAIELLESAYQKAKTLVKNLNLEDKIQVILGDSTTIDLPERVEVAISRIFGNIGSSDGVVNILNDARRFLTENGVILPRKCITKIAAVSLPENFRQKPYISDLAKYYFEQIFERIGYPFDVRLCVRNFPQSQLISNTEIFENLDFSDYIKPEYEGQATFTISKNEVLDGFLLWLNIAGENEEIAVDYLDYQAGWLPVFLPIFDSGISVSQGDIIEATWTCKLSENGLNPNYKIKGKVRKKTREEIEFEFESFHRKPIFKHTLFYDRLFSNNLEEQTKKLTGQDLQKYLQGNLPDYMIPNAFVFLEQLPLSPNGKLDRDSLPSPDDHNFIRENEYIAPRNTLEQDLANIWSSVLKIDKISIHDDFFALGGDSIKGMQFSHRMQELWQDYVYITAIFEAPTIAELSTYLCEHYPNTVTRIYGQEILEKYSQKTNNNYSIESQLAEIIKLKNDEIANILSQLEELSDEEAQQLLTEQIAPESTLTQVVESKNEYFMRLAIAEAKKALEENQPPYAACIVKDGEVISCVHNVIEKNQDITAHAEIQAIREACRKLHTTDLSGCVIYSTCEPCSMCLTACHWANIKTIFSGLRMEDEVRMGLAKTTVSAQSMNSLGNFNLNITGDFLRDEMFEVMNIWLKQKNITVYDT